MTRGPTRRPANELAAFENATAPGTAGDDERRPRQGDVPRRRRHLAAAAGERANLHERFWGQVVRWVVGNDLPAGGQFVRSAPTSRSTSTASPPLVTARVFDKHLAPLKGQKIKVIASSLGKRGNGDRPAGSRVEADMAEIDRIARPVPRHPRATSPSGQVEISLAGGDVPQLLARRPDRQPENAHRSKCRRA